MKKLIQLQIQNNECLDRPSWTQYDLNAYRHKHIRNRTIKDYYIKTKGFK